MARTYSKQPDDPKPPSNESPSDRIASLIEGEEITFNYFIDDDTRELLRVILAAVKDGDMVNVSVTRLSE